MNKSFKLYKNAELILYNLDSIKNTKECVVVEGEIDCLSYIEATVNNVVSVPNGASVKNNSLYYINNCYKYLKDKEKIYIAVDNDKAGHQLKQDLIKRLGDNRCFEVDFKDCKDANEYLIKYGKTELFTTIENAKPVQIDGIFRIIDIEKSLDNLLENGLESGKKIGYDNLDELITWETGRICTVTGIPGQGKSESIDEIIERLNILYGWKASFFSPENFPLELHASKIVSKLTGRQFNKKVLYGKEYNNVKSYMNDNFYFIRPNEDFTLDIILEKAKTLIEKYGIKILVIDPYNRLEDQQPSGMSETKYIGLIYTKLTNFAQRNGILIFLVAHPTKIKKQGNVYDIPNLYDISGSANFFNKTDYGFTVYQDYTNAVVQIHIQKVKFKHLGKQGLAEFKYNMNNGRFAPYYADSGNIVEWDNTNHLITGVDKPEENIKPNDDYDNNLTDLPY